MAIRASVTVVYSSVSVEVNAASTSVEVAHTNASTTYDAISASVGYVDILPVYSYEIPVAEISYIELYADVEIDDSGRYKILIDTNVVLEELTWSLVKAVVDTATAVDLAAINVTKTFADTPITNDFVSKETGRTVRDIFHTSEQITEFAIAKKAFDTVVASETLRRDIEKQLSDGVGINDLVGIPDGITFAANKVVANIVATSDIQTFSTTLHKEDEAVVGDTTVVLVDKPLSDSTDGFSELTYLFTEKVIADSAAIAEELAKAFTKHLTTDQVAPVDSIAYNYATTRLDTFALDETTSLDATLVKADFVAATHTIALVLSKTIAADQVFVDEAKIIYTTKGLQDSFGMTDSGILQMQDYCDISYFLEDYVGVSRSF